MKERNKPQNYRVRLMDSENNYYVVIDKRTNFTFDEACDIAIHELHKAQTERTERCIISIECADCGRKLRNIYVEPGKLSFCMIDNLRPDFVAMYVGKDFELSDIFGVQGLSNFDGESVSIIYDGEENQEPFVTLKFKDGKMKMLFRDNINMDINLGIYLSWEGAVPVMNYELLAEFICDAVETRRK